MLPQQHTLTAIPLEISTNYSCRLMEASYCSVQLQESSLLFDCESLLEKSLAHDPASDPGYGSASSSLSPTSSVDSFCFSPISLQALGNEQDVLDKFFFTPVEPHSTHQTCLRTTSATAAPMKKSRSKYPGKKRQTASEREKLRMRDLTRALNHLRTYLPPSVAPPGQTLTKIETLRLTIRYISYLSEQLGLSEEGLQQRGSSGPAEQVQNVNQFLGQPTTSYKSQERGDAVSPEQLSSLQHSYQASNGHYFHDEQYWMIQERPESLFFTGQS
ncbi:mesoderm posterior protein 2-like [Kryptolebias marmoratus]|uniref:Mesoderm posterior aa n=1 Tax=Kryptolebias marmoratus TaxID=37003 RepID=A0A3Q2ZYT7_KRYMA|nr:mesoderm posterior protein 2-like [Kryptolebias marmoratus]